MTATTRQLLPREERHAQILRAAATAFARGGYAATSMEDVATEAGITKLIVYRHFSSKDELYRSILAAVAHRLHEEFAAGLASPLEVRHGFASRVILSVARENPDGFRLLMVHAAREPDFAEMAERFGQQGFAVTEALIGDAIADPVRKRWACRVMTEFVINGVLEWLDVGAPDRDAEFVDFATEGLVGLFGAWADVPAP